MFLLVFNTYYVSGIYGLWSMVISKVTAFDLSNAVTLRELKNYGQASAYHRLIVSWVWVVKIIFSRYPITKSLSREAQSFSFRNVLVPDQENCPQSGKKSTSTQELFYIFW